MNRGIQVVAIVVNYSGSVDTLSCVSSLQSQGILSMKVIVADNGSIRSDIDELESGLPKNVVLCRMNRNLGYAAALNHVIMRELDRAEYFLLLNNDVVLAPKAVESLLRFLDENSEVGVAGPVVVSYMEPSIVRSAGAKILWSRGTSVALKEGTKLANIPSLPRVVDYVAGCAMMVRRDAFLAVGLFDESYFMYGEEKEFCVRARRRGFETVCVPGSVVLHKEGATANKYPGLKTFYMTRNRFDFMRRYASLGRLAIFMCFVTIVEPLSYYPRGLEADFGSHMRGVFSGLQRLVGQPARSASSSTSGSVIDS